MHYVGEDSQYQLVLQFRFEAGISQIQVGSVTASVNWLGGM
jgi:hypothetical protein